jgi:hypothetical protein
MVELTEIEQILNLAALDFTIKDATMNQILWRDVWVETRIYFESAEHREFYQKLGSYYVLKHRLMYNIIRNPGYEFLLNNRIGVTALGLDNKIRALEFLQVAKGEIISQNRIGLSMFDTLTNLTQEKQFRVSARLSDIFNRASNNTDYLSYSRALNLKQRLDDLREKEAPINSFREILRTQERYTNITNANDSEIMAKINSIREIFRTRGIVDANTLIPFEIKNNIIHDVNNIQNGGNLRISHTTNHDIPNIPIISQFLTNHSTNVTPPSRNNTMPDSIISRD